MRPEAASSPAEDPLTEIPEHLLERSRARRAALGLGGDADGAPIAATDSAPAVRGDAAPAKAAASAPVAAAKKPEVVESPAVRAANGRKKVPWWAAPVLLFLPLWSFLYVQTLTKPSHKAAGVLAEGATIYAKCAVCHGATGGGGVGPALSGGAVLVTFPDFTSHVEWVARGSAGFTTIGSYGATSKAVKGGMPGWAAQLTAKELLSVVYYERVQFGGQKEADLIQLKTLAESTKLPAKLDITETLDQINQLVTDLAPKAG